jgi:hypothetical protein
MSIFASLAIATASNPSDRACGPRTADAKAAIDDAVR